MTMDGLTLNPGLDHSDISPRGSAPPAYDADCSNVSHNGYTAGTCIYKEKDISPHPVVSFPVPEPPTHEARRPSVSKSPYYVPYTFSDSTASSPVDGTSIFSAPHTTSIASSGGHSPMCSKSTASSISHTTHAHSLAEGSNQPPLPASFDRRPLIVPLEPFPPATHYANSDDLTQGFPLAPPTCACAPAPHPFMTNDVTERDWTRFLDDVQNAGGLTPVNSFLAGVAPRAVTAGFVGGYLASQAIKAHIKGKRKSPVAEIIELWNRRFFHPRCMDVVLAQGSMTYTGPIDNTPPDLVRPAPARKRKHKGVKVVEDRSDDEGDDGGVMDTVSATAGAGLSAVGAAAGGVYSQFGWLGTARRGRIELGQDLKHSAGEPWRLVISYKPPVL
ncbi:hypothetical protein BC628DRAFT_137764 [Trametes gibbosa]|nr:hypothetical protein BC628DRAFT_137764 [Trametes gibbosa]